MMTIAQLAAHHENSWRQSYPHFAKVLNDRKLTSGVEVGVAFGGHAEHMLENCKIDLLLGVDPHMQIDGWEDAMNLPQDQMDDMHRHVLIRLYRFQQYHHARRTSLDVASTRPVLNADFVYIDADHRYEAVRDDLRNWWPHVRRGGIIAGHDYGYEGTPGVKKAVDEFCRDYLLRLFIEPATVWWATGLQAQRDHGN